MKKLSEENFMFDDEGIFFGHLFKESVFMVKYEGEIDEKITEKGYIIVFPGIAGFDISVDVKEKSIYLSDAKNLITFPDGIKMQRIDTAERIKTIQLLLKDMTPTFLDVKVVGRSFKETETIRGVNIKNPPKDLLSQLSKYSTLPLIKSGSFNVFAYLGRLEYNQSLLGKEISWVGRIFKQLWDEAKSKAEKTG